VRGQVVRHVWLHGLGSIAAVTMGWLLFAYAADYLLHVPAAVRIILLIVAVALPIVFFWRELLSLLKRVPDAAGIAQLIERAHPDLRELFVSAVQLGKSDENPELVQAVINRAEDRAASDDFDDVLEPRRPRRRFVTGAGISAIALVAFTATPELSSIFFQRLFGGSARWPQLTQLTIEIPIVGDRAQVDAQADQILVRVARGSSVPVLVRAEGEVPDEVTLHFSSGHETVLGSSGTGLFRTTLPSLQEDLEFYATGGDDETGLPVVRLTVLQPPDVSGLAVLVEPPAYSGMRSSTVYDRDVEVLEGSRLTVHMLPDPVDATGDARLLPEDRVIPLTAAPYPIPEDEQGNPASETPGLAFEFIAEASLRYRFELTDSSGLPNPDPGLFGIQVTPDRRPEITVLSPGRAEVDVVPGGAVSLRLRIEDDFGIHRIQWDVRNSVQGDISLSSGQLTGTEIFPIEDLYGGSRRRVEVARVRLEVDELSSEALAEGQLVVLQVEAADNREPEANVTPSSPVRMRVVNADEFLRRLQDRLARAGEQANRLSELQEEKKARTSELLAVLASDDLEPAEVSEIGALLPGQRRVQGDARALARELASVAESLLFSRVDERGGPLLETLDTALGQFTDRSFHPEPWRELADMYGSDQLGSAGLAGKLVEIVGIGLEVSEEHTLAASDALVRAQAASDPQVVRDAVSEAYAHQDASLAAIGHLLEQLAEWDNFQSILTLTRDILNRQKNLTERTRQFTKDH
jgi:hypothetical protein